MHNLFLRDIFSKATKRLGSRLTWCRKGYILWVEIAKSETRQTLQVKLHRRSNLDFDIYSQDESETRKEKPMDLSRDSLRLRLDWLKESDLTNALFLNPSLNF